MKAIAQTLRWMSACHRRHAPTSELGRLGVGVFLLLSAALITPVAGQPLRQAPTTGTGPALVFDPQQAQTPLQGPLKPELLPSSTSVPSTGSTNIGTPILDTLLRPRTYGLPQGTGGRLIAIEPTSDWAESVLQLRPGMPTVLTYHMIEGVSRPLTFSIEYDATAVARRNNLVASSAGAVAPDADPKNSIYGRDLSSIPNLVLHCQRVIREILKKYDAAGFQPLDNQLRFRLIAGFDGNSAYLWTEREIHIYYQRPTLEMLHEVLAHEMFHAMQHAKGYNVAGIITRQHLWFDETTADYASYYLVGSKPNQEHVTAKASYFLPSLFFGEYINLSEEFRMHEYQGCVFLKYYLETIPGGSESEKFGKLFDFVMRNSGYGLTDLELPTLMDRFSKSSGGLSLGEIYSNFVKTHVFQDSDFFQMKADASDFIYDVEQVTTDSPEKVVSLYAAFELSARAAKVSVEVGEDESRKVAVYVSSDAEHFTVWGKVADSLRGPGDIQSIPASEASPWLVEVPKGKSLFLLACNIDIEERDGLISASNGVAVTVRLADAEDQIFAELDAVMGEWMAASQEIQATQRNLAPTVGVVDVAVTATLMDESKRLNEEFARRLRAVVRKLKCVPTIEIQPDWGSNLEEVEPGLFHADEWGEFSIELDQVVALTATGPEAAVKRITRNFALQRAVTDIEITEMAPLDSLRGRWTGSFTIREMPALDALAQEPVDPDDPIAVACAEGLARFRALKNRALPADATFTPGAGSRPGQEIGTLRLVVRIPGQEEAPEPKEVRYRYEGGALVATLSDEGSFLRMRANFRWRDAEEGGGGELSGEWNATEFDAESNEYVPTMNGVWRVILPADRLPRPDQVRPGAAGSNPPNAPPTPTPNRGGR